MFEKIRLYQSALEDLRARRDQAGEGYWTSEERNEIHRLQKEVSDAYSDMEIAWLESLVA